MTSREARRQKRIEQKRQAILDAARITFARVGIEAATMQEIADQAGYGAPSLYNYFPGKEDILNAVMEEIAGAAIRMFRRLQNQDEDFRSYFESLMLEQFELVEQNREYFYLLFVHHRPGDEVSKVAINHSLQMQQHLENILASGMEQGSLRIVNPTTAALLTQAAARSVLMLRHSSEEPAPLEELLKELSEFIFHGLGAET